MRIPELGGIRNEDDRIEIGAGVRMTEAERESGVPLLERALRHVGHPAIRNAGTVCGSPAHGDPAAEVPAALLALDAEVVLRSARASEQYRPTTSSAPTSPPRASPTSSSSQSGSRPDRHASRSTR